MASFLNKAKVSLTKNKDKKPETAQLNTNLKDKKSEAAQLNTNLKDGNLTKGATPDKKDLSISAEKQNDKRGQFAATKNKPGVVTKKDQDERKYGKNKDSDFMDSDDDKMKNQLRLGANKQIQVTNIDKSKGRDYGGKGESRDFGMGGGKDRRDTKDRYNQNQRDSYDDRDQYGGNGQNNQQFNNQNQNTGGSKYGKNQNQGYDNQNDRNQNQGYDNQNDRNQNQGYNYNQNDRNQNKGYDNLNDRNQNKGFYNDQNDGAYNNQTKDRYDNRDNAGYNQNNNERYDKREDDRYNKAGYDNRDNAKSGSRYNKQDMGRVGSPNFDKPDRRMTGGPNPQSEFRGYEDGKDDSWTRNKTAKDRRGTAVKRAEKIENMDYHERTLLKKIADWMMKYNITDLSKELDCTYVQAVQAWCIELSDFINWCTSQQLQMRSNEAMGLAKSFVAEIPYKNNWNSQEQMINLDKLTDTLIGADLAEKDREILQKGKANRHTDCQLFDRVAELITEHIARTGGSVFQVFREIDTDGSSYINESEMHKGLLKLGGKELTLRDAGRIIEAIDENKDGAASYMDFRRLLSHVGQSGPSMDDPYHWAYAFCEDLRRKIASSGQSLIALFCAGVRDTASLAQAKLSDLNIPWDDFVTALEKMRVRMRPDEEDELQALLDAKVGRGDGKVNLAYLQSLVGVPEDFSVEYNSGYNRYMNLTKDQRDHGSSETVEVLMKALIDRGASASTLRLEFSVKSRDGNTVTKEEFKRTVDQAIASAAPLEAAKLGLLADLYATKSGTGVDYKAFLEGYTAAQGMAKAQAYLFGSLETAMAHDRRHASLTELLRGAAGNARAMALDADEMMAALKSLDINIRPDEIKQLLMRYDPSGAARSIELRALEQAYAEQRTTHTSRKGEKGQSRSEQKYRGDKGQIYQDFDDYCGGKRCGGHGSEEEKTLAEVVRAFQGDEAFLAAGHRQLDPYKRGVTLNQFAKYILDEAPRNARFYQDDVEDMLTKLAQSRDEASDVDIGRFTTAFVRTRDDEELPAGTYAGRDGKGGSGHRGPDREPVSRNPLLPGQSPTQTRAGASRRPGAMKTKPKGFTMPRRVETGLFEEIMCACYVAGELVEDHFDSSARPGRGYNSSKVLDFDSFGDAMNQLRSGRKWSPQDIQSAFDTICEGFGIQARGKSATVELAPSQVDEAVDYVVPQTVSEMQEATLEDLRKAVDRADVDLSKALEAADRRKGGSGGLDPGSAARVIEQELPKLPNEVVDGLELLVARYVERGKVEIARLVEDLVPPRLGGRGGAGRPPKYFGRKDDARQVQILLGKISSKCSQEDAEDLARRLGKQDRGNGGLIPEEGFRGQLAAALRAVSLREADTDLLVRHYAGAGQRGAEKTDYRAFIDDLHQALRTSGGGARGVSLTTTQEKELRRVADQLQKANAYGALTRAFRSADARKDGYLSKQHITEAFETAGVQLHDTAAAGICSAVTPNKNGKYPFKELLERLAGEEIAAQLYSATVSALRNDSWQTGGGRSGTTTGEFKAPREVRGAASGGLAEVGEQLLGSGRNYEQALLDALGTDSERAAPQISEKQLNAALSKLGVRLRKSQNSEITSFFQDNRRGQGGKVDLIAFLRAVGLPAQSVGGARSQQQRQTHVLTPAELAKCATQLSKIRRQIEKRGQGDSAISYYEAEVIGRDDVVIRPKAFLQATARAISQNFVEDQDLDGELPLLVAYLAEEVPEQISLAKLRLAFTYSEGDAPLPQYGEKELKAYQAKLRAELAASGAGGAPVPELAAWMTEAGWALKDLFPAQLGAGDAMPASQFVIALTSHEYDKSKANAAKEALVQPGAGRSAVSLTKLKSALKDAAARKKEAGGRKLGRADTGAVRLSRLDPQARADLERISSYLQREGMTTDDLHARLASGQSGDGVARRAFVERMAGLHVPGLRASELGALFDALDVNDDGSLSAGELGTFIQGARRERKDRLALMDPETRDQMDQQIDELFKVFDEDGDGSIDAEEIRRTMQAFGVAKTVQQCKDIIRTATEGRSTEGLDRRAFGEMMRPYLEEEHCRQEEGVEELRAKFREADADGSGFLSASELWTALKTMDPGAELEDVVTLMSELDVDGDGQLGVDEFVALLSCGDQVQFANESSRGAYRRIRQGRRLNPRDFLKSFKNMPTNFGPSFIGQRWKARDILPSSAFKAQIDPQTMLWKDILPPKTEQLTGEFQKPSQRPNLLPITTALGASITLVSAQGVPLPAQGGGSSFKDEHIVKRAVRIAIEHTPNKSGKPTMVHNAIQVPALWTKSAEDIWRFDTSDKSLRSFLLRTTLKDGLAAESASARLLLELVVYVKSGVGKKPPTEMSCGWCELNLQELNRATTHKLKIQGGDPSAGVDISDKDVRTGRSGLAFVQKVLTAKVENRLELQVKPYAKLPAEVKHHMEMLPSTCLVPRPLLYFASGFMNYKARVLLKASASGPPRKPPGDVVLSSFPKIFDCPDILEELATVWHEDLQPAIDGQKRNIELTVERTKEAISRLYPILHSEAFEPRSSDATLESAAGDTDRLALRGRVVQAALRYGALHAVKQKPNQPPSELTTFKPFAVRELEYEVWDTSRAQQEGYKAQFGALGLLAQPGASGAGDRLDPGLGGSRKTVTFQEERDSSNGGYNSRKNKY